ncbi:hypothetical protein [Cryobacterium algoricola]|uniref:hypothetical protein n=1 Tax=Cryobacterium algoricola TaxID=1259183 RepID=UPI00106A7901|nr:hypothetical protein [Cryobacterium algoricola]
MKEQASHVAEEGVAAGQHVAAVTKDEVVKVAATTKKQAKELLEETRAELAEQAGKQQQRVATGLHSLGDELRSMAESSDDGGVAADLVQQAASRAEGIATWLEERDPGSLLVELRNYARRQPGTFIGLAAAAGVLAGRLTRSVVSGSGSGADSPAAGARLATPVPPPVVVDTPVNPYTPAPVVGDRFGVGGEIGAPAGVVLPPPPVASPVGDGWENVGGQRP